jgi:Taurine catabolism dioxygenase TauD, TfdA family
MTQQVNVKPPQQPAVPLAPVNDSALWYGRDMTPDKWMHTLTAKEIGEIETAVKRVEASGLSVSDVTRDEFVLPTLGPVLDRINDELINGRGFYLIRGLPIERYSEMQTATAFWGLGQYFGEPVSQNAKGHLLGHVKDLGHSRKNAGHRGYQTSEELNFHSDSCDMTALLCLTTAKSGGISRVASSAAIHNEMLKRNPNWAKALAQPLYRDRRNEVPPGLPPWYVLPVFSYHEGYLTTSLAPSNIQMAQRHEQVPRLTPDQKEALRQIDVIGGEVMLQFELQRGDIELVHNHVVLHSRTNYEDYEEPERKRHLLRLWMSTPRGRPLPSGYYERYGGYRQGRRPGGIITENTVLNVSLEA